METRLYRWVLQAKETNDLRCLKYGQSCVSQKTENLPSGWFAFGFPSKQSRNNAPSKPHAHTFEGPLFWEPFKRATVKLTSFLIGNQARPLGRHFVSRPTQVTNVHQTWPTATNRNSLRAHIRRLPTRMGNLRESGRPVALGWDKGLLAG